MDEPDAHLSSEGQQDLLKIFDAFARPVDGRKPVQVVYVTHSPFLIDKNYAERIRVLEKGVSEEGTRVVRDADAVRGAKNFCFERNGPCGKNLKGRRMHRTSVRASLAEIVAAKRVGWNPTGPTKIHSFLTATAACSPLALVRHLQMFVIQSV
jgi:predicted ATP-binding protein involved in virulence